MRGKSLFMDGFRAKCAGLKKSPSGKPRTTDPKDVLFHFGFLWSLRWEMLVRNRNANISFCSELARRVSGGGHLPAFFCR